MSLFCVARVFSLLSRYKIWAEEALAQEMQYGKEHWGAEHLYTAEALTAFRTALAIWEKHPFAGTRIRDRALQRIEEIMDRKAAPL